MPEFTITREIEAPIEKVWEVLEDFGGIAKWNTAVKRSAMTSQGVVGEGTTRHCDFSPLGGVGPSRVNGVHLGAVPYTFCEVVEEDRVC